MHDLSSCLYECQIMHHRLHPISHRFEYPVFMFYLNLNETTQLQRLSKLIGFNRWNLYSFLERDHLPISDMPLTERVKAYLHENGVTQPIEHILLLTNLRTMGYLFNPVSFYFCLDTNKLPIAAIAEVSNTFYEMKPFLVPLQHATGEKSQFYNQETKFFYVSPYSDLTLSFEFRLFLPSSSLELYVNSLHPDGTPELVSSVKGKAIPLNTRQLLWFSIKYPLITVGVITLIHWEALWLWLKRVPFHSKEAHPDQQRAVLRPHKSIKELS